MSNKFDRVLSEQELSRIFEGMGYLGGHGTFLDIANEVQQAVLEKLAEQEPVAWTSSKIFGHYATHDTKATAAEWFKESLDVPLYVHPMPCVSHASDKTACVSENTKCETQASGQGFLDSSNQDDNQELPPLPEADVYGYIDSYSEELLLEYAKNAIDCHRTTKNRIPDDGKMVVPDGWQLVPKEPTEEMIQASDESDKEYSKRNLGDGIYFCQSGYDHYLVMLAAAPKYTGESK